MVEYHRQFAIDAAVAALTDATTGLPNRRAFSQQFLEAILDSQHAHNVLSLLVLDLDQFGEVSKRLGYSRASELLGEIGAELGREVSGYGTAFRHAGDKFAILVPRVPSGPAATLSRGLRAAVAVAAGKEAISCSIGIATFPDHATDAEALWSYADHACQIAMSNGKIIVYDPTTMQIPEQVILGRIFPCRRYLAYGPMVDKMVGVISASTERKAGIVVGPAGIGKSRFLDEIGKRTASNGARVIEAVGAKITANRPFGMLTRAISRFLRKSPLTYHYLADKLGEDHVLMFVGAKVPVPSDSGEAKAMASIILDLVRALAVDTPVMLVLDDAHYIDAHSVDLLEAILVDRSLENTYLCASARDDLDETEYVFDDSRRVPSALYPLHAGGRFHWTEVPRFERSVVVDYVSELIPVVNPPDDFFDVLHGNSDGTPLMLEELLKHLILTGVIRLNEGLWEVVDFDADRVPSSPQVVLDARVRAVPPDVREVLTHAASIGREFTVYLLTRLSGRNEGHLLDLLDRARKVHLIHESGVLEDESFAFISELAFAMFRERALAGVEEPEKKEPEPQPEPAAKVEPVVAVPAESPPQRPKAPVEARPTRQTPAQATLAAAVPATPKPRARKIEGTPGVVLHREDRILAMDEPVLSAIEEPKVEEPPPATEYEHDPDLETPLSPAELPTAVLATRLLKAALKNISLFPPTSRIISVSVGKLFVELRRLLDLNGRIVIAERDGDLVVNSRRYRGGMVDRTAGEEFRGLLNDLNLRGLCFGRRLDEGSLRNALFTLAEGDDGRVPLKAWPDHFVRRGVRHVLALTEEPQITGEQDVPRAAAGTRAHFEEVEAVVRGLVSSSEDVRNLSLKELEEHGGELLPPLARFIRMCPDDELRRVASFALWQASNQDPAAILEALQSAGTSQERMRIAAALDVWQKPATALALLRLLDDPEQRVRTAAARSLEKLDPEITAPLALKQLSPDNDERSAVLVAILRNAGHTGLAGVAASIVARRSPWDKPECGRTLREAALVLGRMGDSSHVEPLVALARRIRDERVRLACVWSLGSIGDAQAAQYLREEAEGPVESVADAARRALERIAGT